MKHLREHVKRYFGEVDLLLFLLPICMALLGFIFISSAVFSFSNSMRFLFVQGGCILIGLVGMIIISKLDYEDSGEIAKYLFGGMILMLIAVALFGVGDEVGNRSWFRFFGIGIQPSELAKIIFAITFASHISHVKERLNSPKVFLGVLFHFLIVGGLVLLQGDLGSFLVFFAMAAFMCYAAGLSLLYFGGAALLSILSLPIIWSLLKEYHKKRILVVLYPELDPTRYGYQAAQCKTAIGSGQIWGRGLYEGTLTQYELIPAKHTDSIFAVIGEEGGFMACAIVILFLSILVLRCFMLSRNAKDNFGSLVCAGIGSMFFFQAFINIGMCIGILPVIGITLPFFSYGGTSVVISFWALGLIQSIHRNRRVINF